MVLCSICSKKRDQPLYTIFMKNFMEKYLAQHTIILKRAFIKENYKEYCHLGCLIFYLPTIDIIQEKYYLTKDKYIIDYILFGLEQIHQSKQQTIDCPICDQGLEASQKKASIGCKEFKCKNQYHIDCIITVKKRVIPKKSRIYFYCNQHYDKNELHMDWNQWEQVSLQMVEENITKKQEEPYRGDRSYIVLSVDDPDENRIIEKLDQNSYKRLDEDLVKKVKIQKRQPKPEPEKKRKMHWHISKDFQSQYEFQPRPMFQIDYSAKSKHEILNNKEEEYPKTKKIKQKEEITITDTGFEVNQVEIKVKKKKQEKESNFNTKISTSYIDIKNEIIIDLDKESKEEKVDQNNAVSFDQLLDFVREKKSIMDPDTKQEDTNLQSKNKLTLSDNTKLSCQTIRSSRNLDAVKENSKKKTLNEQEQNKNAYKKKKEKEPEKVTKTQLIPNADMINLNEEKRQKSKPIDDYSCMSGAELLNYLLNTTENKRSTRGKPKLETTRQIRRQNKETVRDPLHEELWDFNLAEWQDQVEKSYFSYEKDILTVAEEYLNSKLDDQIIRVLYELGEDRIFFAEYQIDSENVMQTSNISDDTKLNIKLFKSSDKNPKIDESDDEDVQPQLLLRNLNYIGIDQTKRQSDQILDDFLKSKNTQIYADLYLEKYYENQLNQLMESNQENLTELRKLYLMDRANNQMLKKGHVEQDKLRLYDLLKSTQKGMKFITEEDHQLSIMKKIELLTNLRVGSFSGKCHIETLKPEQKDELSKETCCKICFDYQNLDFESNNDISYCEECGTTFHINCYNCRDGSKCDLCRYKIQQNCLICQKSYQGFPMKLIEGNMYHITCALLNGSLLYYRNTFKCKKGIILIQQSQNQCFICEENKGYKLKCQCCEIECHLLCAFLWGFQININTSPDCIDPYIDTDYICPAHGTTESEIQKQIYFRWHGINYNLAACFDSFELFLKGKFIAYQKTFGKIQNMLKK